MTAKEFLSQAYRLEQRIRSKLQQMESIRSLAETVTTSYGSEVVSRTRNVHSLEEAIVKLTEVETELGTQISTLIKTKTAIGEVIDQVHIESCRLILEKRYLCYMDWSRIASELNYSERWVMRQHRRGLDAVNAILKKNDESVQLSSVKFS